MRDAHNERDCTCITPVTEKYRLHVIVRAAYFASFPPGIHRHPRTSGAYGGHDPLGPQLIEYETDLHTVIPNIAPAVIIS